MKVHEEKNCCSGCCACKYTCPQNAISMIYDRQGFLYPEINQQLCNSCGLCREKCPFHNDFIVSGNYKNPYVYAAKHRRDEVRMNSSSGGIFTAISDYVLNKRGVVYGAAFDDKLRVIHKKAVTLAERDLLRGSKYVQSSIDNIILDIKKELTKGKLVLFTGTPCQNAGLSSILSDAKNVTNLLLCDVICHGTPSPNILQDYLTYCEFKKNSKITGYSFRYKGNGWGHTEQATYANGETDSKSLLSQSYKDLFYSHMIFRPACYNCGFCRFQRPSDITLADFWGIEKCLPDFVDDKGVSLVLINSQKGESLFKNISSQLYYEKSNAVDCLQRNLYAPTEISPHYDQFWREYYQHGFGFVINKYTRYNYKNISKQKLKSFLKVLGRQIL
jgi:coenzyme F420-reducing hydrogenase beta subunit